MKKINRKKNLVQVEGPKWKNKKEKEFDTGWRSKIKNINRKKKYMKSSVRTNKIEKAWFSVKDKAWGNFSRIFARS